MMTLELINQNFLDKQSLVESPWCQMD